MAIRELHCLQVLAQTINIRGGTLSVWVDNHWKFVKLPAKDVFIDKHSSWIVDISLYNGEVWWSERIGVMQVCTHHRADLTTCECHIWGTLRNTWSCLVIYPSIPRNSLIPAFVSRFCGNLWPFVGSLIGFLLHNYNMSLAPFWSFYSFCKMGIVSRLKRSTVPNLWLWNQAQINKPSWKINKLENTGGNQNSKYVRMWHSILVYSL